jgi:hypothetical protein
MVVNPVLALSLTFNPAIRTLLASSFQAGNTISIRQIISPDATGQHIGKPSFHVAE